MICRPSASTLSTSCARLPRPCRLCSRVGRAFRQSLPYRSSVCVRIGSFPVPHVSHFPHLHPSRTYPGRCTIVPSRSGLTRASSSRAMSRPCLRSRHVCHSGVVPFVLLCALPRPSPRNVGRRFLCTSMYASPGSCPVVASPLLLSQTVWHESGLPAVSCDSLTGSRLESMSYLLRSCHLGLRAPLVSPVAVRVAAFALFVALPP